MQVKGGEGHVRDRARALDRAHVHGGVDRAHARSHGGGARDREGEGGWWGCA